VLTNGETSTALLLCMSFSRAREAGLTKNNSIQFPLTQQRLADTLGISLIHTNNTLRRLLTTNTIRSTDGVFEVVNQQLLSAIAREGITFCRQSPLI